MTNALVGLVAFFPGEDANACAFAVLDKVTIGVLIHEHDGWRPYLFLGGDNSGSPNVYPDMAAAAHALVDVVAQGCAQMVSEQTGVQTRGAAMRLPPDEPDSENTN